MKKIELFVSGKMGAGSSWLSNYIESNHGAIRWSRTELMKRLAHALINNDTELDHILELLFPDFSLRQEVLDDLLAYIYKPELGKPRKLYQEVTAICQEFDSFCFERELHERMKLSIKDFVFIDDVRSRDAFDFFTEKGFVSLRIETPESVRRTRIIKRDGYLPSEAVLNHASETELDFVKHDFVIYNTTTDPTRYTEEIDRVIRLLTQ